MGIGDTVTKFREGGFFVLSWAVWLDNKFYKKSKRDGDIWREKVFQIQQFLE